jgi:hypothetical protein
MRWKLFAGKGILQALNRFGFVDRAADRAVELREVRRRSLATQERVKALGRRLENEN